MVALIFAASLQELSEKLERTPFEADYTASRKGTDLRYKVTIRYSPPNLARLTWHTPDGDMSVSTDGEHLYSVHPRGSSSLSVRELSEWMDGVYARLRPRIEALAEACGRPTTVGPLGKPTLRIELSLSRSGIEGKPFNLAGGISFVWEQTRFGWLDAPGGARVEEAGDVVRVLSGEIATEIDSGSGILRSISVVEGGETVARVERHGLEKGKEYPRSEFVPAGASVDSRAAWQALCPNMVASFVLSTALHLLPEDPSAWKDDVGRALDSFLDGAADEALPKLYPPEVVEVLARAYAQTHAPKEKVLRMARIKMEMQIRGTAEKAGKPGSALVLQWRKALCRRFRVKVMRPVLERLEEILSKRKTPWR